LFIRSLVVSLSNYEQHSQTDYLVFLLCQDRGLLNSRSESFQIV
jgi:hypothetical protein